MKPTIYVETKLEIAIKNSDYKEIENLLKQGVDINEDNSLALRRAILFNNLEMVKFLLSKNASVDIDDKAQTNSPLSIAVGRNYRDLKNKKLLQKFSN